MRKKGIATLTTWIISILIILLVSTAFIVAVFFLAKNEIIFGKEDEPFKIPRDAGSNSALEKNLNAFLNKKTEFEEESITILELIENNPIKEGPASDLFNKEAEKFFSAIFPFPTEIWKGHYSHPYWISVYNKEETVTEFQKGKRPSFNIGGEENTGNSCAPFNPNEITLVRHTKDKKIILCVNKRYLKLTEGNK